jgi:Fe-S cluster assembly protein SufD
MKSAVLSLDALQAAVEHLPDSALMSSRRAALEHLREHGLPTTRDEDWKYTDLSAVVDIGNRSFASDAAKSPSADVEALIATVQDAIEADWLVIINGQIDSTSLDKFDQDGTHISRLSDSAGDISFDAPLSDLNLALLHDGLRIHIAKGTQSTRPIGILVLDEAVDATGMSQARVEIELESGSSAAFIEYHASIGSVDHYGNSVNSLRIGDNARADYVRIQDRSLDHKHTNRLSVRCERDSQFNYSGFDLGGNFVRNDITVDLTRPGSCATFDGLYLIGEGQHIDNHTRVDHRTGPAESHQEYRGILAGKSRGIWNGKAIVHEGADGTDAEQANHNLLLSDHAEIDAKPELEIYADDVKCSHGTTVGQLDETSLFYLRTRGLSKREAKQVLTTAFAQSIVSKAHNEAARDYLQGKVAQRLDEIMQGAES